MSWRALDWGSFPLQPRSFLAQKYELGQRSRRVVRVHAQAMGKKPYRNVIGTTLLASLVLACSVALTVAMPADAQRPENSQSVRVGRLVAQEHCASCHAVGRRGQSPNPKAPRFPLIAERYPGNNPAPVLIDGTVVRHPGMPEFRFLENETDGLVAYIRRISRRWRP
jgi:mono/diheme cytochrome c family protein